MKFHSIALMFMILAGYSLEVYGQFSGVQSSGMFGNRTMGGAGFSGMSSGMGGNSGMGGGMGMSGVGGGVGGGMGMGGMGSTGMGGMGNTMGGQSGQFIGANTGGNFVGGGQLQNQGQGMRGNQGNQNYGQGFGQNFGQNFGGQYGGQFGGMNRMGNQFGRGNQFGQGGFGIQNNANQTQLPVVRHVDFEYAANSSTNISSALSQSLLKSLGSRPKSSVAASFQGNILVLKGTVASEHDRDLAGILARMEPGVDQVQNDLVVQKTEAPDLKK